MTKRGVLGGFDDTVIGGITNAGRRGRVRPKTAVRQYRGSLSAIGAGAGGGGQERRQQGTGQRMEKEGLDLIRNTEYVWVIGKLG